MIFSDEAAFAAHVKEKSPLRVYWLYGDEKYLTDYYCEKLKSAVIGEDGAEFGTVKFDENSDIDDIMREAITPPWLSLRKCIIVENLVFYNLGTASAEKFFEMLDGIPNFTVIIFKNFIADKKARKSAGVTNAAKKIGKIGGVAEILKRDDKDIVKCIKYEINKKGCDISPDAARYFTERCGNDMYILSGEIEKLGVAAKSEGKTKITKEDIDTYTVPVLESSIYDMTNAIARGNYKRSMKILDELLWRKTEPVAITAALAGLYIDMYRAKTAVENRKGKDDILRLYEYKGTAFRVENAIRDCASFSLKSIEESLFVIRDADIALKGSGIDKTVVLQRMITKLFDSRKK